MNTTGNEAGAAKVSKSESRRLVQTISVRSNQQLTPKRRRIIFAGGSLTDFRVDRPAQWIKLFFPAADSTPPAARVYTILAFDQDTKEMTVDFYLHEDGIASDWAARAQPGKTIEFAGPAGSFQIAEDKDWYLLVADDSSLPALLALAAELPRKATAHIFIEVDTIAEELPILTNARAYVTWIHRSGDSSFCSFIRDLVLPDGDGQAWITGENSTVRTIRQTRLEDKCIPRSWVHASSYWKRGESAHKDQASDY